MNKQQQTEFGTRVEQAMIHAEFTQEQLAISITKLLDLGKSISQQSIQHLIQKGKSSTYTVQIALACNVNPTWLATGNGDITDCVSETKSNYSLACNDPNTIIINKLSAEGGQGNGISDQINHDEVINQIEVTKEYIKNNLPTHTSAENLRIITGRGRSMLPLYNDGEPLIVDTGAKTLDIDAVFVLWYNDELVIKNVQRKFKDDKKSFLLIPENKTYDTIEITEKDNFHIVGLVLGSFVFNKF